MMRSASFRLGVAALEWSFAFLGGCAPVDPAVQDLLTPGGGSTTCPDASCTTPTNATGGGGALPHACNDGIRNGEEEDVDCGGPTCAALGKRCIDGAGCRVPNDCQSSSCGGGKCLSPTCTDGVRNGVEVDVDCGAACGPGRLCSTGRGCASNSDCASGICNGTTCVAASCSDGLKNQDETDVDCGGRACQARCSFSPSQACRVGSDCISLVCNPGSLLCAAPSCTDGVTNGDETDVDCGGSCAPKQRCGPSRACRIGGDCDNQVCAQGLCAQATCIDGVQNGNESDVDCGGPCPKCPKGKKCHADADCDSDFCHANSMACIELWSASISFYPINSLAGYNHILYVALQDITGNNPTWIPPAVPALWRPVP